MHRAAVGDRHADQRRPPRSARSAPSASTLAAITLPASSARTGTLATRISTIRVCFSSVTLCAICRPNVNEVKKKTSPNANGTRYASTGSTASGSSSSTGGAGAQRARPRRSAPRPCASTRTPVGPATTAASTSPSRTSSLGGGVVGTVRTSRPARVSSRGGVGADHRDARRRHRPAAPAGRSLATAISRKNTVLNRNVLSRSLTRISRAGDQTGARASDEVCHRATSRKISASDGVTGPNARTGAALQGRAAAPPGRRRRRVEVEDGPRAVEVDDGHAGLVAHPAGVAVSTIEYRSAAYAWSRRARRGCRRRGSCRRR